MHESLLRYGRVAPGAVILSIGSLLAASGVFLPTLLAVASADLCGRKSLHCIPIGPQIWPLSGIQVVALMLGARLPGIDPGSTSTVTQTIYPPALVLILLPALLPLIAAALSACMLAFQRGLQLLPLLWRVVAVLGFVSLGINAAGVAGLVFSEPACAWEFPTALAGALMPVAYAAMLYGAFTTSTPSEGRTPNAVHAL